MRAPLVAFVIVSTLAGCGAPGDELKIPHLIGYAGTPQEVDLGPFVDWDHAYSEELGAYYQTRDRAVLVYADGDCAGATMAITGNTTALPRYIAASDGLVHEGIGAAVSVNAMAVLDGSCVRYDAPKKVNAAPTKSTGIAAAVIDRALLSVELR